MAELKPIFDGVTQIAGIDDDIAAIKAIVDAVKNWEIKKPASFADITALLTALDAKVDDPQVVAAFQTLGLADARTKVAALLKKVTALGQKIPAWVKTLIRPLDSFDDKDPGALSWVPVAVDKKVPLDEPFSLGIKGGFSLGCTASTTTDVFGDASRRLMKLAVHGDVSAEGGATIPYSLGTIKAGVSAGLALDLAYYYDFGGSKQLYVAALAEKIVELPLPFDYGSAWAAVQKPGFAGLDYVFAANAGANLDVGLAYLVEAGGDLKIELGGKIAVAASYARGYRLSLSPASHNGAPALAISLKRTRLSALTIGASLEVTIDAPRLRAKVQDIVKTKLALWDKAREDIQAILSPGTYLQTKLTAQLNSALGKLITNDDLRKALGNDLGILLGKEASDTDVIGWLADAIKGAIDRYSAKFAQRAQGAADGVVDGVMNDLGKFIPDTARDAVKAEIAKLVGSVQGGFDDAVQKLLDSFAGDGKAFQKKLKEAGAEVQGAVDSLDKAFAGVRSLLEKYNAAIHDIAEKAQAAVAKKISLSISYQNKRTNELTLKIDGVFTDPAKASELFKLITGGDLKAVRDQLFGVDYDGFELNPASSFEEHDRLAESLTFEVVALGFGATYSGTLTADAKAIVDAAGNVQIDSAAAFNDRFVSGSVDRTVGFGNVLTVAATRSIAGTQGISRTMKLGVSVGYGDKKYSQAKLDGFLDDLVSPQHLLISQAEAADARMALTTLIAGAATGTAKAEISAELWMDGKVAETVMLLGDGMRDGTGALTLAGRRRVFEAGLAGLVSAGTESNEGEAKETTKKLKSAADDVINEERRQGTYQGHVPDALVDKYLLFGRKTVEEIDKFYNSISHNPPDGVKRYIRTYYRLDDLADMIAGLGKAYLASPTGPGAWLPARYLAAQTAIAIDSQRWLSTNAPLFSAGKSVAPIVLALMLALEELAGGLDHPVTLTLTDQSDPAKLKSLVI
jgi:hypothetical protein